VPDGTLRPARAARTIEGVDDIRPGWPPVDADTERELVAFLEEQGVDPSDIAEGIRGWGNLLRAAGYRVTIQQYDYAYRGYSSIPLLTEVTPTATTFALGPDFMADGTVMMSPATFARLLPGNPQSAAALPVEFGVVKVRPDTDLARVQQALRASLPDNVRVLTRPQLVAFERAFQADLSSAGPIFWMGTVVGFVVGMLISYQIIYTDLSDQLPQYATLKGMGYETGYLVRVVIEQAALSGLAGYLPAWLLCLVVYRVIGALALLPLTMTWQLTLLSLGLTLGMCVISALLAIRRVIAADPAEVF